MTDDEFRQKVFEYLKGNLDVALTCGASGFIEIDVKIRDYADPDAPKWVTAASCWTYVKPEDG